MTTTDDINTPVVMMTAVEAHDITRRIKASIDTTWKLLAESYDREAWRALAYASWRDYAIDQFGISQSRAYQLLDMSKVVQAIEAAAGSTVVEITERDARALKPVLTEFTDEVRSAIDAFNELPAASETTRSSVVDDMVKAKRAAITSAPRRPLPDQYGRAVYDVRKAVEKLWKLSTDDRFGSHRDRLSESHLSDVDRAVQALYWARDVLSVTGVEATE